MATTGFRLSGITIDCLDPHLVARFWAGLLGGEPRASLPGWYELGERGGPRINFIPRDGGNSFSNSAVLSGRSSCMIFFCEARSRILNTLAAR